MIPKNASASPPIEIVGPDSFIRYHGVVVSTEKVKKSIGTSDTTGEDRDFLEVKLKVESAENVELVERPELPPVQLRSGKPTPPPEQSVVPIAVNDQIQIFYFKTNEPLKAKDRLTVSTRTKRSISYGWTSSQFGATYTKK